MTNYPELRVEHRLAVVSIQETLARRVSDWISSRNIPQSHTAGLIEIVADEGAYWKYIWKRSLFGWWRWLFSTLLAWWHSDIECLLCLCAECLSMCLKSGKNIAPDNHHLAQTVLISKQCSHKHPTTTHSHLPSYSHP